MTVYHTGVDYICGWFTSGIGTWIDYNTDSLYIVSMLDGDTELYYTEGDKCDIKHCGTCNFRITERVITVETASHSITYTLCDGACCDWVQYCPMDYGYTGIYIHNRTIGGVLTYTNLGGVVVIL